MQPYPQADSGQRQIQKILKFLVRPFYTCVLSLDVLAFSSNLEVKFHSVGVIDVFVGRGGNNCMGMHGFKMEFSGRSSKA